MMQGSHLVIYGIEDCNIRESHRDRPGYGNIEGDGMIHDGSTNGDSAYPWYHHISETNEDGDGSFFIEQHG